MGEGAGLICKEFKPKEGLIKLYPLGDVHYGASNCDRDKFIRQVEYMVDTPNAYMLGMGDLMENATRYSVGAGVYQQIPPEEQFDELMDILRPMRKRIIGMITGNHEERTVKEVGLNPMEWMCDTLKTPYLGYACFLKLTVGKQVYTIYATHGSSGARLPTSKLQSVMRLGSYIDADILCFDEKTEVLTLDGWKKRNEIKIGDQVYNLNPETEEIEEDTVFGIVNSEEEEYYSIETPHISQCLSKNHNVVYKHSNSTNPKWLFKPVKEVSKMGSPIQIGLAGQFRSKGVKFSDDEIRLTAWIIAEGHFKKEPSAEKAIMLFQNPGKNANKIQKVLTNLNLDFSVYNRKDGLTAFYIKAHDGKKIRARLVSEKRIPTWCKQMNKHQFDLFLETLILGDGSKTGNNSYVYYSADELLIDQLQILCVLNNYRTRKKSRIRGFSKNINFELNICNRNTVTVALSTKPIQYIKGHNSMWCVSTHNGTVITRRNGCVSITGNCQGHVHELSNYPAEVRKIDLENEKVITRKRYYVLTGSYLKYEGGYAEKKNLMPAKLGCPRIKLYSKEWDVHIGT